MVYRDSIGCARSRRRCVVAAASLLVLVGCAGGEPDPAPAGDTTPPTSERSGNPPAEGFDSAGSDPRAIEIADATMAAMGGRQAWDETRYLAWNFFGFRYHVWDKSTGEVRVVTPGTAPEERTVVTMNLHSRQGRAWVGGQPVTDPEALDLQLQQGYEAWINDAYWLFMPYKLKDSGVTLTYLEERPMADGRPADVLELTFEAVGVTPENKYRVYVARDSGLVEQWDFFAEAADAEPRFQTPWHDWRRYGRILLSGDRGQRQISEIAVLDELPDGVFDRPEPTGLGGDEATNPAP
jgi:hypothetical protein